MVPGLVLFQAVPSLHNNKKLDKIIIYRYTLFKRLKMISTRQKSYLTTGEIAKILHVSRVTVYNWIKLGRLKAVRIHRGKYRVSRNDFAKFLKQHDLENQISSEISNAGTVKILVVDNEPDMVGTIKAFLEKSNLHYHVAGATSGFEAGLLIRSFAPDIIILDLVMPGIDGFSICRKIKQNHQAKNIKIIAITGRPFPENVKRIKKEGVSEILEKPFKYRELLSRVKKLTKS